MSLRLPLLADDPCVPFPPAASALREPNGLLAMGGDLSPTRLLNAYRHGIFPWFSEGQPILWWSPDPRMVFRTDRVRLSSRLRRELRRSAWIVRADSVFEEVVAACATAPRRGQRGTWITDAMRSAYAELHHLGHAHSVEIFDEGAPGNGRLVGGIYGVVVGRMFFGESMCGMEPGASKVALAALARHLRARGWPLIDAQVESGHLRSLGAESWTREDFLASVDALCAQADAPGSWAARFGEWPVAALATQAV